MNDFDLNIDSLKKIIIDKEFEGICPNLSKTEFETLEENILADGEVSCPLFIWNNILIDGHHRRQIILKHPQLPFQIKQLAFSSRYEVIAWICRNQIGRRNLNHEQLDYLIGKRYESEKQAWGATNESPRHTNQNKDFLSGQIDHLKNQEKTSERIAKEYGLSEVSIRRNGRYAKGVDTVEAACPGFKEEHLSGKFKANKPEVIALANMPVEQIPNAVAEMRKSQEEKEEKRRIAREEQRCKAEESGVVPKAFKSIGELSSYMAEPKPRNNISNVLGIIGDKANEMQAICMSYISEFPQLLGKDRTLLIEATDELRKYLNDIYERRHN